MNARLPPPTRPPIPLPPDAWPIDPTWLPWLLGNARARSLRPVAAIAEPGGGWLPCAPEDLLFAVRGPEQLAWIGQRPSCRGLRSAIYLCRGRTCWGWLAVDTDEGAPESPAWPALLLELVRLAA